MLRLGVVDRATRGRLRVPAGEAADVGVATGDPDADARWHLVITADADPGRPVNVHLHHRSSPVWRETLVFRDRLRADPAHRDAYHAFKRSLAAAPDQNVTDYGRAKRGWVNDAVGRAEQWAQATGWVLENQFPAVPNADF